MDAGRRSLAPLRRSSERPSALAVDNRRGWKTRSWASLDTLQYSHSIRAGRMRSNRGDRGIGSCLGGGRPMGVRWERQARAKLQELDAAIADLSRARRILSKAIDCACGGEPSAC
jgi:hypothetical protein